MAKQLYANKKIIKAKKLYVGQNLLKFSKTYDNTKRLTAWSM